jgi:D-alanyl-D-alanine carboxypeptidase
MVPPRTAAVVALAIGLTAGLGGCDLSQLTLGLDDALVGGDAATAADLPWAPQGDTGGAPPDVPAGPAFDAALAATLQGVIDGSLRDVNAPGLAVGVVRADGSYFEGVTGLACLDPRRDVAPGDRFRVGSITKSFVAATILLLVDEGLVTLEDRIAAALPELAGLDARVTVRMLLNHTSGIFNISDDARNIEGDPTLPVAPAELVGFALAHSPVFEPGQGWDYSNTNYILLGMLIESVTGEPVAQVLRARLFSPLHLADTFFEGGEDLPGGLVCGHAFEFDTAGAMDPSWSWTAGAIVSNARDLCAWLNHLVRGDVLAPDLRAQMQARTVLPSGKVIDYGFGIRYRQRGGREVIGHSGLTLGFEAEVFLDAGDGTCVAALANDFDADAQQAAGPVWSALP